MPYVRSVDPGSGQASEAGRATLLNVLATAIPPGERVVTIEDADTH
jgi:Flp pilus assembly CpaF family ATPase